MATPDQIKIRVERLKTVAEVNAEIDRVTRTTRLSGSYNLPETQAFLAALQTRKQQLTEQPAPRVPNFTPGGNAKRGGVGVADDNKANPPIPKKKNVGQKKTTTKPATINAPAPAVETPTTQAGEVGTLAAKFGKPKPGKRLENPLSNFSSYTYQLSLYMITPDAYNAFIDSGRTNINAIDNITAGGKESIAQANQSFRDVGTSNSAPTRSVGSPPASSSTLSSTVNKGGAFLVAQSGGINNNTDQRAPGFDTDFYIEDLKFTHLVSPNETQAACTVLEISFKIIEPYGFSFIAKLKKAQMALQARSSALGYDKVMNATRNVFILGIKFLGYDENGDLIDPNRQSSTLGNPIGNARGIYERFVDIKINEMKFRLDGKSVTYNINAIEFPISIALGTKRGILEHDASVEGSTVREALTTGAGYGGNGLLSKLNKDQKYLKDTGAIEIAAEWDFKFQGDAEKIATASLISPADLDKRFWPQSTVKTAKEANAKKDKNPPNNSIRRITFTGGTPILQAINEIIKQSSYLEKALLAVTKSETEPDNTTPLTANELNNPSPAVIEWFNVRPEVQNLGWDNKQKDFVFKTTYYIQTYSTPYTLSAYAGLTSPYYGPDKRYDYWFTGKNSELLKLDVAFDNNFYVTTYTGSPDYDIDKAGLNDIPAIAGKQQNQSKQGFLNFGAESPNSYMASLFDIKAWAASKLTILGDPDFLMGGVTNNLDTLGDKFYGSDGYTINPSGRQVFIEVNFNNPQDYDNDSGLLSMNDSIYFFDYPKIIKEDLDSRGGGIILQVVKAISSFNKGKFEQQLDCIPAIFYEKTEEAKADKDAQRPAKSTVISNTPGVTPGGTAKQGGRPRNPNQTAATAERTGVDLTSATARRFGAGRGSQGGPTAEEIALYNFQVESRRDAASRPQPQARGPGLQKISKPKQDQTTTIRTKDGRLVQDDNAGTNMNPTKRH
jgi:hypothetical protein